MGSKIVRHRDLDVYRSGFEASMMIFGLSKEFPKEEIYSLTDQIRRSSRAVCSCLAEAWRRRRFEAAFVNKINEAEAEAAETQTWLEFAVRCKYLDENEGRQLFREYESILATLVGMVNHSDKWILTPIPKGQKTQRE
jgi:four helix bundle protein